MQLTVKGYRGIDRAEVEIPDGKVTLFAGANGAGKSSLIEAIRYNASANRHPLGLDKKDIDVLVHDGAKRCEIILQSEAGTRKLILPDCEISGSGVTVGEIALGMNRLGALKPDDLANVLAQKLDVGLDKVRLEKELAEIRVGQKIVSEDGVALRDDLQKIIIEAVFGTDKIKAKGWDSAQTIAEGHARAMKTQFGTETGTGWGSSKGFTFMPKGWEGDLAKAKLDDLVQVVVSAKEAVERAIAENAVTESEMETLRIQAEKLEGLTFDLATAGSERELFEKEVTEARAQLAGAKQKAHRVTCQECGASGFVDGDLLLRTDAEPVSADSIEKWLRELEAKLSKAQSREVMVKGAIKDAEKAKAKLAEAKLTTGTSVDAAHAQLAQAQIRVEAFKIKTKGMATHCQILAILEAAELLSPMGLRRRVLVAALPAFNQQIQKICEAAGWLTVSIDKDLMVRYGNRPYVAVSGSEKYRVDATLQLAIAKYFENAPLVVFDEADELEREGRNQLLKAIAALKLTGVIGIMFLSRMESGKVVEAKSEVPRLKPAQGVTYWVGDRTVERLEPAMAGAAS